MEGSFYDHGYDCIEDYNESIKQAYIHLKLDIDEQSAARIKESAYFSIKMRCGLKDGKGSLMNIDCNSFFLKMVDVDSPNLNTEIEGFDAFKDLVTPNWIEFYQIYINFFVDFKENQLTLPSGILLINNPKKREWVKDVDLYKKVFVDQNNIYTEVFFKFNLISNDLLA